MTRPHGFEIRDSSIIADVGFLSLERRRVATPTGSQVERFVVSHPGAVAIVPRRGNDVVLIAQYRVAVDEVVLEIPAGKLDITDIDHETAARRELAEETGLRSGRFEHLMDLVTSVGFSNEVISLYVADDLESGESQPAGAEEFAAEIVTMAWDDALAAIDDGSITDAKTVVGILLANRRGPA